MYCRKCGNEVRNGAAYCGKCGAALVNADPTMSLGAMGYSAAPISRSEASGESNASRGAHAAQPGIAGPPNALGAKPSSKRSRRAAPFVIAVVAVVAVAIGGVAWYLHDQDVKRQAWEESHTAITAIFAMTTPGFDADATAIPVQVEGTDLDGATVSETQYVDSARQGIRLMHGEYDVRFPGGYFTGAGGVVKAPDRVIHVRVDENVGKEGQFEVNEGDPVEYAEAPAADVTDDLLDAIEELAKGDPEDNGKASRLRGEAAKIRDQAVEEKRAAEEAARQAEEEARRAEEERQAAERAAALHVETPLYSFDLPDELYGKVRIEYESGDGYPVSVFATELGQAGGTPIFRTKKTTTNGATGALNGSDAGAYEPLGNAGLSYTIVYGVRDETSMAATTYSDKDEWFRLHNLCIASAKETLQIFRPDNTGTG